MSVQSAGQVVQSLKLFAANNTKNDLVFVDFVGLCGGKKSKNTRRRTGNAQRNKFCLAAASRKNWVSSIKSVLELERIDNVSEPKEQLKPKVASLEDILSERGACVVGFIANLDNIGSHKIVKDALVALGCMEHRGGCGADNDSGDGSGLMTSIPWDLFNSWANEQGIGAFDPLHTRVGMLFLPKDDEMKKQAQAVQLAQ